MWMMREPSLAIAAIAAGALFAGVGCNHEKPETMTLPTPAIVMQTPTIADAPFEGEIELAVYEPTSKTPSSIVYDVRGDKVRSSMSPSGPSTPFVMSDLKSQRTYVVDDAKKSIATIDVSAGASQAKAKTTPTMVKTGKMEKVSGHDCEDWSVTDDGERFDMCVTKGTAYFDLTAAASPAAAEPVWAAMLTKERAFPLRVVATNKSGQQEFRAEATKIESRKLDDALFNVPSAYHNVAASKAVKVASIP